MPLWLSGRVNLDQAGVIVTVLDKLPTDELTPQQIAEDDCPHPGGAPPPKDTARVRSALDHREPVPNAATNCWAGQRPRISLVRRTSSFIASISGSIPSKASTPRIRSMKAISTSTP